jgi:DNA-binding response OmpR family regulator
VKPTNLSKPRATNVPSPACPGQPASGEQPFPHPARRSSPRANRILLVDDDPSVRHSLTDVLLTEGYVVVPAENGQQAIHLANQLAVELVLLDLNMPVMSGWDTFERLTREHPLLPIIIITARPNQVFTSLSAGAAALLEKPMDVPMLLRAIKHVLAETAGQRLARLIGKHGHFHYRPAPANRVDKPAD